METRSIGVLLLLGMMVPALPAEQTEYSVGGHGARLKLGREWVKRVVDRDLGPDQWVASKRVLLRPTEVYVVVREVETLLENVDDYRHALSTLTSIGHDNPVVIQEHPGFTCGTRSFRSRVNGLDLAFQVELLHRDGLAYCVLAWSVYRERAYLSQKVDEFRTGFAFPPDGSAWAKSTKAVDAEVMLDGHRIRFSIRPSVFRSKPLTPHIVGYWCSADEEHAILVDSPERYTVPDRQLSECVRQLARSDGVIELARSDVDLDGVRARMVIAKDDDHTLHLVSIPMPGSGAVQVRYLSRGDPELARADRELFLRTLRLVPEVDATGLPPVPEPVLASPLASIVQGVAPVIAVAPIRWHQFGARLGDGRVLIGDWQSLHVVAVDGTTQMLLHRDGYGSWFVAEWQGQLWTVADDRAGSIDGGRFQDAGFAATSIATAGLDLLFTRMNERPEVLGLDQAPAHNSLWIRGPDGAEKAIVEDLGMPVGLLSAAADGRWAVAFESLSWPEDLRVSRSAVLRCLRIDLVTRSVSSLEAWESVSNVVGADGGWLVSGIPGGRPEGIYLLGVDGSIEPLLLHKGVKGAGKQGHRLWFTAAQGNAAVAIRELDLEEVDASVRHAQPFAAGDLDAIGTELVGVHGADPDLGTAEFVRRTIVAADALAEARVGRPLPRDGTSIDTLFETAVASATGVGKGTRFLLALLVAVHALEAGAEWVDATGVTLLDWVVTAEQVPFTPFAVTHTPPEFVRHALDDGEAGSAPVAAFAAERFGRPWVTGVVPRAVAARVGELKPAGFDEALMAADVRGLTEYLEAMPTNERARAYVYRTLAGRGALAAVETIGSHFASLGGATAGDHVAWLTTWSHREPQHGEATALFDQAHRSVRLHPDNPSLCLVLAIACERAKPTERALAQAYYQRVLAIQQYGDLAEYARKAIARLVE